MVIGHHRATRRIDDHTRTGTLGAALLLRQLRTRRQLEEMPEERIAEQRVLHGARGVGGNIDDRRADGFHDRRKAGELAAFAVRQRQSGVSRLQGGSSQDQGE
jgi:hypothetical protein